MAVSGLFGALDIAISGMAVSRLATQIINHNIANANTPGYSRQTLSFGSAHPANLLPYGAVGRGVEIYGVERSRDDFLAGQVLSQAALWGDYATRDETLRSIESIVGSVDNDRIGTAMGEFFSAWSDLSTPPLNQSKRQSVLSQAQNLVLQFQSVDRGLRDIENDLVKSFEGDVRHVNSQLHQIAELNSQILRHGSAGQVPHDLVDQRDYLVRGLSEVAGVRAVPRGDGTVDVLVGGHALVVRGEVNELRINETQEDDGSITRRIVFGRRNDIPVDFEHGSLSARQHMINEGIDEIRAELDELASELADRVNELHRQGATPVGIGVDFFTGSTAADIAINSGIAADPSLIATGSSGADGDNTIALAIAALGEEVGESSPVSLNQRYERFLVGIATERSSFATLSESQYAIVEAAAGRLDAAKGVNLDEELANLVIFQHTYEANARVVRVIDEMLDTLVNGLI